MVCRMAAVLSYDAAGQFVSAVAHCAFEALRREDRLDEQCAADLSDLAAVEFDHGTVCVLEAYCGAVRIMLCQSLQ